MDAKRLEEIKRRLAGDVACYHAAGCGKGWWDPSADQDMRQLIVEVEQLTVELRDQVSFKDEYYHQLEEAVAERDQAWEENKRLICAVQRLEADVARWKAKKERAAERHREYVEDSREKIAGLTRRCHALSKEIDDLQNEVERIRNSCYGKETAISCIKEPTAVPGGSGVIGDGSSRTGG